MNGQERWIRVTDCKNIPLREGRLVRASGHDIAVFNLGERFLAVENRCPHKGGPLSDGIVSGAMVVCPLHAWKVSLETGQGVSPAGAQHCIRTFPTRIEHGFLMLKLPAESLAKEPMLGVCMEAAVPGPWIGPQEMANQ